MFIHTAVTSHSSHLLNSIATWPEAVHLTLCCETRVMLKMLDQKNASSELVLADWFRRKHMPDGSDVLMVQTFCLDQRHVLFLCGRNDFLSVVFWVHLQKKNSVSCVKGGKYSPVFRLLAGGMIPGKTSSFFATEPSGYPNYPSGWLSQCLFSGYWTIHSWRYDDGNLKCCPF